MLDTLGETVAAKDIENAVMEVTANKMMSPDAGKMGYSATEIGDWVADQSIPIIFFTRVVAISSLNKSFGNISFIKIMVKY